ncbi:neutral ceramidase [Anthonomus grandis grandis]|uniref:neutral ceramidase n=1 Tax=Anthonomus grandis grandis TaxID=2921223 RepID=UPI002165AE19|nr:neutral ceramidase [Anthonomus grandis grandis]XP_050294252.1 neutral ceramidase [Anthonomus grandis grandis]XP_050294253.1 neutral ceramidase [Anthonomus grandis grandis]
MNEKSCIQNRHFIGLLLLICPSVFATYQVGVGRADMTGPAAEVTLMGYAKLDQQGCGIHLRQFARAFIFDDGNTRVVFVSADACMVSYGLKNAVINKLQAAYNQTYTHENIILSGTHTHGAPGGFLMDVLYDITQLGFCKETLNAYSSGIFRAIQRAHENMVEARLFTNTIEVVNANINRSPASYENNPEEERKKYQYNTDKTLRQLKITRASDNQLIGAINWYAVHAVSLNNTNCMVTSDNVGYASILLESEYNSGQLPGQGSFVGAFASSNLGDVSPNLNGPICVNSGQPCDYIHSTCNGDNKYCIASGPGNNMYESAEIIANRLFENAEKLLANESSREITGQIKFIHQWVEMPKQSVEVKRENGTIETVKGCLPAMGYAFAAGTTDGPGEFDFKQASTSDNPFWNIVRDFIFPPKPEDIECHYPKPILMNTGRLTIPYSWQPKIVSTQILLLGNFALIAVPGEFTTMSGRRLRDTVQKSLISSGADANTEVVLTGLSNTYTSYIATYEEYQIQRYEAAATIFGPHTLEIYQALYTKLAEAVVKGETLAPGPEPEDLSKQKLLSLITPVIFDSSGWFWNFGDVTQQPPSTAKAGDTVSVKFIAGHPRNNVMAEKTFLTIEKENGKRNWTVVATDASIETRFIWKRTSIIKGGSEATVQWIIPKDIEPGTYRIQHYGNYKYILGGIYPYSGATNSFAVTL